MNDGTGCFPVEVLIVMPLLLCLPVFLLLFRRWKVVKARRKLRKERAHRTEHASELMDSIGSNLHLPILFTPPGELVMKELKVFKQALLDKTDALKEHVAEGIFEWTREEQKRAAHPCSNWHDLHRELSSYGAEGMEQRGH